MRGAVRGRTCPACDATVADTDARWCGACGEALGPADADHPADGGRPVGRRRLALTAAAALVAVAVVLAVAGDGRIGRDGGDGVGDLDVAAPDEGTLEDLEPAEPPEPETVDEPTCVPEGLDCFLWAHQVDTGGPGAAEHRGIVPVGDLVLAHDRRAATLTALDLRDGTEVWSVDATHGSTGETPLTTDGTLVLHADDEELVARDLATGRERWRSEQLGRSVPVELQLDAAGDVLVVAAEQRRTSVDDVLAPGRVVLALDPATGALLWHERGQDTALGGEGAVVVVTPEGEVRVREPTGEVRWEASSGIDAEAAGVDGAVLSLLDADGAMELWWLSDGDRLEFQARVTASTDEHTLLEVFEERDDDDGWPWREPTGEYVLLDADGEERWRTQLPTDAPCVQDASFGEERIELDTCEGGTVVLDDASGAVLATQDPPAASASRDRRRTPGFEIGAYVLDWPESDREGDLVLTDADHAEVARFPRRTEVLTWPGMEPRVDEDVLLFHDGSWLVALDAQGAAGGVAGEVAQDG